MQIIPRPTLGGVKKKFRYVILNDPKFGEPRIGIASSARELIGLLSMNLPEGQAVRIIDELPPDNDTLNYGKIDINKMMEQNNATGWAAGGELAAGQMINTGNVTEEQLKALQAMHGSSTSQPSTSQNVPQPQNQQQYQQQPTVEQKSEPTYFKIGSVECKMENGKVYQKQWMRVNETEMANYRLISDKNNKILPMSGKHLEVLRWTISEDNANG